MSRTCSRNKGRFVIKAKVNKDSHLSPPKSSSSKFANYQVRPRLSGSVLAPPILSCILAFMYVQRSSPQVATGAKTAESMNFKVRTSKWALPKSQATQANSQYGAVAGVPPWRLHRWLQPK